MSSEFTWYNGYSPEQRLNKLVAYRTLLRAGKIRLAEGPCALCCDPAAQVELHDEDYSEPHIWGEPAQYCLCLHCHRHKLHTRFLRPNVWTVHLAHVRRGGYASDLKHPEVRAEVGRYRRAIEQGRQTRLAPLRPYDKVIGAEWFHFLSVAAESLRKRSPATAPRSPCN